MIWYCKSKFLRCLLWPLSLPMHFIVFVRRLFYKVGIFKSVKLPAPVIVVGNLTVGGSGKTPLVVALVKLLRDAGYKPGVVSRGYGGKTVYPCLLNSEHTAKEVGDEPLLIAQLANCPVVVDPKRVSAARYLLDKTDCNIIVSDDGLQHYAMQRDLEIVAINGSRRFGNGLCLPVGPLRVPLARLQSVDMKIVTAGQARADELVAKLVFKPIYKLQDPIQKLEPEQEKSITAVSGIANPERFFKTLADIGFDVRKRPFPDHYPFAVNDFKGMRRPIVLTEKDAMRCKDFTDLDLWALPIEFELPQSVLQAILNKLL